MAHTIEIDGLVLKTGDLICTVDGGGPVVPGQFWRLIGKIIPGEVDHVVVYIGPRGKCIEAGPKGVASFEVPSSVWDAPAMLQQRLMVDKLYGIAYPLERKDLSAEIENGIRKRVAEFCLAQIGKPYNFNFLDSATEDAFYCSQLAYKAYLREKIDLNTGRGVPQFPGTSSIIFPQEIWESCHHERP